MPFMETLGTSLAMESRKGGDGEHSANVTASASANHSRDIDTHFACQLSTMLRIRNWLFRLVPNLASICGSQSKGCRGSRQGAGKTLRLPGRIGEESALAQMFSSER